MDHCITAGSPAYLKRVEMVIDFEDRACPCCRNALHRIGEDVNERLDIVHRADADPGAGRTPSPSTPGASGSWCRLPRRRG